MDELKAVAKLLGLPETATLDEILAAIKAVQDQVAEALKDDPTPEGKAAALSKLPPKLHGEVVGALTAVVELKKQVEELRSASQTSAKDALIAANANKIPAHMDAWVKQQSVEVLTGYFSAMPEQPKEKKEPVKQVATDVTLSDEEVKLAKLQGIDAGKLLEFKKQKQQKKGEVIAHG